MNFLKRQRMILGLTQEQLSEKIGCHKQQIYNYESGKTSLPLKYAKSTSKALNIPLNELREFLLNERMNRYLKSRHVDKKN